LNGDGGDEDFAGYQRYWMDGYANIYTRAPHFLTQRLIPSITRRLPDRSDLPAGHSLVNGLKRLEQLTEFDSRASILRWGSYFSPRQRAQLWKQEHWQNFKADNAQSLLTERFDSTEGSFLDKTLSTDLHTYLSGDLLVKADRMTMAASLEGRSPFLDHKVVEWSARVPDQFKVRGRSGKYLLKKAFESYLPENVKRHRKQGFGVPIGLWFRGPLYAWAKELLVANGNSLNHWFDRNVMNSLLEEHRAGRVDHSKRIYALTMLALWSKGLS
jgi:asparagine synthase (glutamine-hydrolysing)